MSKARRLTRKEVEELGKLFGERLEYDAAPIVSMWRATHIVCRDKREPIGVTRAAGPSLDPDCCPWTNHDWTKAFQRVSGVSSADLWSQKS